MAQYDVCMVGAGLLGSATAKYLASNGIGTCLIGPAKSAREDTAQREIYDAWGDASRITHTLFPDAVWAHLAIESIKRYRLLEEESGVHFFTDTGYLVLSDSPNYIKENADVARKVGTTWLEFYDNRAELQKRFPYLQFPTDSNVVGVAESRNAGLLNPAKLVEAQRSLFLKKGGTMMDDIVTRIHRDSDGSLFKLETRKGSIIQATKVVVCAGAFLGHNKLLPDGCRLDVRYRPALAIRIRVDPGPILDSLVKSPPLIFVYASSVKDGNESSIYTAPPIRYADGHHYLKIGYLDETSKFESRSIESPSDISAVYQASATNNEEIRKNTQHLLAIAKELFKGLQDSDYIVDTCCWTSTPSVRPYIGSVAPDWFVITGDNGFAAKSSDEIGRLASELVAKGKWSSPFMTQEDAKVVVLD